MSQVFLPIGPPTYNILYHMENPHPLLYRISLSVTFLMYFLWHKPFGIPDFEIKIISWPHNYNINVPFKKMNLHDKNN